MSNEMAAPVRDDTVLDSFERVTAEIDGLVTAVIPARLGDPTPCTDWTVRDLINHIVHVTIIYADMAAEKYTYDQAGEPGDYVGDDHVAAFRSSRQAARSAFTRPGMLAHLYASPWGDVPGSVVVQHVINELVVHAWDLATATGQPTGIVPDVAEQSLAVWRAWIGQLPRGEGLPIAAEQPVPEGASAADRLAAYLGRTP